MCTSTISNVTANSASSGLAQILSSGSLAGISTGSMVIVVVLAIGLLILITVYIKRRRKYKTTMSPSVHRHIGLGEDIFRCKLLPLPLHVSFNCKGISQPFNLYTDHFVIVQPSTYANEDGMSLSPSLYEASVHILPTSVARRVQNPFFRESPVGSHSISHFKFDKGSAVEMTGEVTTSDYSNFSTVYHAPKVRIIRPCVQLKLRNIPLAYRFQQ